MDARSIKRILQQILGTPELSRGIRLLPAAFISQPPGKRGESKKMKKTYSIYENRGTYFLEIDHKEKTFQVGSVKGKVKKSGVFPIDSTGYKAEILKIGTEYKCLGNHLFETV